MAHDVFISHSSNDKKIADAVCATLESHEIRCWIAPRDVQYGAVWAGSITEAIRSSRVMILIYSHHVNHSKHVLRELEIAVSNNVVILPFRIEDVAPSAAIEFFMSSCHWLDGLTGPLEEHLEKLGRSVQMLVEAAYGHDKEDAPSIAPAKNAARRTEFRARSVSDSDDREGYSEAVRLSSLVHLMRKRLDEMGPRIQKRIVRAKRRTESNLLETLKQYYEEKIVEGSEVLEIDTAMATGVAMLRDGVYAQARSSFDEARVGIEKLSRQIDVEESRLRSQSKAKQRRLPGCMSGLVGPIPKAISLKQIR